VGAGLEGVADDRVFIDTDQARGLPDAAAVVEVAEDGEGLVVGQARAEQGGPFALGEPVLAGAANEHAALVVAVAEGDAEVASTTQAVVGTVGVLTAEKLKVFHEKPPPKKRSDQWTTSSEDCRTDPEARQR
jgi:hypothetical protein